MTHLLLEAVASPAGSTYHDVFQHTNTMNLVAVCMLVGGLLFFLGTTASVMLTVKDAQRVKQAREAGEDYQKRAAPRMRFLIPVMVLAELALIAAPVIYAATVSQPQTVSAMQANVKDKYGADLQLVEVSPNRKLMQASSPDKPDNYILTFPDGTTGTYSVRFDKGTSEPFVLNSDGTAMDPSDAGSAPPADSSTSPDTTGASDGSTPSEAP